MNILALAPGLQSTGYEYFASGERRALTRGELEACESCEETLGVLESRLGEAKVQRLDLIALRAPYGGTRFDSPRIVDGSTLEALDELVPQAPLHLPRLIEAVEACRRRYHPVPVVLVFDTAFFTRLPAREAVYGIDPEVSETLGLRRLGYHGVFHEQAVAAACSYPPAARSVGRLLSVCLEPQPEVAGILDGRPLIVTGGSTPLEGLPGENACGEVDPAIILTLAKSLRWGTEQIDLLLSRDSGLHALAARAVTVREVLESTGPGLRLPREVLRYRILLAAGAAKAAMGGVDVVVFSGRYARSGACLSAWLCERLSGRRTEPAIRTRIVTESLLRAVADQAEAALRSTTDPGAAPWAHKP